MNNIAKCSAICLLLSAVVTAAYAQDASNDKNEIGLVIGATLTPSVARQGGGDVKLNSSLALGAEYDRRLIGHHTALYGGVDFLASPFDVKARLRPANVSPE